MRKLALIVALTGTLLMLGKSPAFAHDPGAPGMDHGQMHGQMHGGMPMNDPEMTKMRESMRKMMFETQEIILESLKLVEKTAMDDPTRKKAQELQKRMEKVIADHSAMHEEMMKNMKSGAEKKK